MANFYSSMGALENLLIGLGRGYRKETNRRARINKAIRAKEELSDYVSGLVLALEDFYPRKDLKKIAKAVSAALPKFKEPPRERT